MNEVFFKVVNRAAASAREWPAASLHKAAAARYRACNKRLAAVTGYAV